MQQRRGTAEQWLLSDPVLGTGEIGFETDTNSFKIGDGVNVWTSLEYFSNSAGIATSLADYVLSADLGIANGVATLDANGFVPAAQLNIDVSGDIATAVAALVDAAPGTLDTLNELAAAIGDDANFITTVNTSITDGDAATLASANTYADGLAVNYDAAGAAATAEANANTYTDTSLANFTTLPDQTGNAGEYLTTDGTNASWAPLTLDKALNDITDVSISSVTNGQALVYDDSQSLWVNATVDVAGAIATANAYTDSSIAAIPAVDLTGYATEAYVGTAVSNLVDSAPATLDTLNELAAALGDDPNFATTVTNTLAAKTDKLLTFSTVTGSRTLALTDADKMLEVSAAATITVPSDAIVNFPVGTTINITQTGTGTVTASPASGVTLNYTPSNTLRTQWSSAVLVKRAANTWLLSGDLL